MVDIKGLDKARVLKSLYDHSHVKGMGVMQAVPTGFVTVETCAKLLEAQTYFDYLYGRVIKVELSGDEFDERLYDRDCGDGAAQRAVDSVRAEPEDGESAEESAEENPNTKKVREQAKLCGEAEKKIIEIIKELPHPAQMALCIGLAETFSAIAKFAVLMMCGPVTPPPFRKFDIDTGGRKERDIPPPPFPWDLSSMLRQG